MPGNNKPLEADNGAAVAAPEAAVVMIYATFPDKTAALATGRAMVAQGYCGCVNVLPGMTSVYVWKGATETSEEAVLIAKLAAEGAEHAVAFIHANHSYETPAVLVIPISGGSPDYIAWIRAGTQTVR